MRKVSNFGLLAAGATFFVAACDQAPTTPSNDGPGVSAAQLVDNPGTADGAASFERLELCKVWVGGAPFATTFTIQADDPINGTISQNVTIDGTESPVPGCKNVLQFDGTAINYRPADNISIVESAPPTDWAVTDISTAFVFRDGGSAADVNAQADVLTRTWTADHADNRHGILVTFENTFTPPGGGEGCTPGFWKNRGLTLGWPAPYSPGDSFDGTFGVVSSFGGTLEDALNRGGGGESALGRHAVAALLNAASGGVDFDLSEGEVIALVQAAYASGDFEDAKDELAALNEQGCPL